MDFRNMTLKDYSEVVQLWQKANLQLTKSDELAEIQRMIEHNPETCLLGVKDGKIIGAVLGGFDGRRGYIHHLAILPEYQGQHYGPQLLQELENRFAQKGVVKVHLFVEINNLKVTGFYDRLGYVLRDDLVVMSKVPSTK